MTSPQAASVLGIGRTSLARLIRQGKLPAIKIANRWLIERSTLQDFAASYVGKRGRPNGWSPRKEAQQ